MSEKIIKTYKFRLYPSKAQVKTFEHWLDLCRELYNAALQERRDAWKLNRVSVSYFDQSKQLPEIKTTRQDVADVNSQVLQDVLRRLDKTFKAFFSRVKKGEKAGFPRFKNQKRFNSFCFPQVENSSVRIENNKLNLPKIGKLKIKLSRNIVGKIKTCTIKREIDKWFVLFSVELASETLPKTGRQIGIDVGIESFATLSDGTQIENFRFFERSQKQLRKAQRKVARRKKFSNQWRKAIKQVSKIHERIKNQRNDFQHKISTSLVKDFDLIAIEKLNIVGMSRGFLAKQINDAAWSGFFQKLKYKAENAGKSVMEVNPKGTSQTCICGERVEKDLSVRWHHCGKCGLSEHRDVVSAKVILKIALGQSVKTQTYAVRQSVVLESAL